MGRSAKKSAAKTKTFPYDVAEQLRTPEEMAAYLDAWLSEVPDDAAGIARALGNIARRVVFLIWTPRGDETAHLVSCRYPNRTQTEPYFSAI